MRWLRQVLAHRHSDKPLIEIPAADGAAVSVLTYRSVFDAAIALAAELTGGTDERSVGTLTVGVLADNSAEWLVADLACLLGHTVEVSVPLAFSKDQVRSLLRHVDVCLVDAAGAARLADWGPEVLPCGTLPRQIDIGVLAPAGRGVPAGEPYAGDWVCKVVHTSGTTSVPKGVRIRAAGLDDLLRSLTEHIPAEAGRRYLSVVPLSLLVEQVSAVYLTMLNAGTVVLLPPEVPLLGAAPGALSAVLARVPQARPTAMQGPPALFEAFARTAAAHPDENPAQLCQRLFGHPEPAFLACGGAPISAQVIDGLLDRGIPVYEGYGLSENSSVVSLNTPDELCPGSVGRPLPHVRLRIADDGELLVRSTSLFAGYDDDGEPSSCVTGPDGWLATGDLATIDDEGFLHIRGRKKNIVITSAGRNVAADWVASRYRELPDVVAAVVFGEGLDELVGFFVISDSVEEADLRADMERFGVERLSSVERVRRIEMMRAGDPRLLDLFTVTGRPRKSRIWALIRDRGPSSTDTDTVITRPVTH